MAVFGATFRSAIASSSKVCNCEKTNLDIINDICLILNVNPEDYISFVEDRKGHDFRYAIDNSKINKELNWTPKTKFMDGLATTINFYRKIYS